MVAPLQFLDYFANNSVTVRHTGGAGTAGNVILPVGTNFQANDLRVLFVYRNATVGSHTGWTSLATGTYGRVIVKTLTAGDTDGAMVFSGGSTDGCSIAGFTVRNWDPAQTLSAAVTNAAAAATISAPSRTAVAGGALICCWGIPDVSSGGTTGIPIAAIAAGMLEMAEDGTSGINFDADPLADHSSSCGLLLGGLTFASGGSTGTKSATMPTWQNTVAWVNQNFSIFINQAPDKTFAIGGASETGTAGAITLAKDSLTSFKIGVASETDTPGVILFKTQSQWTDWDMLSGYPVQNSLLTWKVIPGSAGSTVTVKTSIDNGATWQLAVNGGPIPNLNKGNTTATSVGYQVTETRLNAGDTPAQVDDLWPRIAVDDGYDEMLPLGTFVINASDVAESGGSSGGGAGGSGGGGSSGVAGGGGTAMGGGMVVTLTAPDYSYIISRRTWDDVFFVAGGTGVMDAVAQIAVNRMPDVKLNLGSTPHTLQGPMVFGSDQGQNDPWNDLMELVASIGWEIYFNIWGELTTRPIPDPSVDAPVWIISDGSDGNSPTICGYTKTTDDATTFSHVIAQGESTNNPAGLPVMAEWFNIDPASNTNIYSDFGDVTTVYQSVLLGTTVQCQQAADAIGRFSSGTEQTLKLDHLPLPFLEQSDLVAVVRPLGGISGTYQINGWTFPLGPNGVQSSDIYRQKAG